MTFLLQQRIILPLFTSSSFFLILGPNLLVGTGIGRLLTTSGVVMGINQSLRFACCVRKKEERDVSLVRSFA